jgi:antitoxin component YwqK of YwqJK toxin-antitoxin module
MKDGLLNGKWVWYRTDGSVMRIGSFRSGVQTGTWETFDADGNLVSSKTH